MLIDLWVPQGVTPAPLSIGGRNVETGGVVVIHTFHFKDARSGRRCVVKIPADDQMSKAQIEDMASIAFENWLEDIRTDGKKRAPTPTERKEIGRALGEFRKYARKRRASTNRRIYYEGRLA